MKVHILALLLSGIMTFSHAQAMDSFATSSDDEETAWVDGDNDEWEDDRLESFLDMCEHEFNIHTLEEWQACGIFLSKLCRALLKKNAIRLRPILSFVEKLPTQRSIQFFTIMESTQFLALDQVDMQKIASRDAGIFENIQNRCKKYVSPVTANGNAK